MAEDRTMRLRAVEEDDVPDIGAPRRRPLGESERTVAVSISGPSGHRVDVQIPRSLLEGVEDAGGVLLAAIDYASHDTEGTAEQVARRRAFLQGLPEQIMGADGSSGARHIIMQEDSELGSRPVHPRAPIDIGRLEAQEMHTHFVVAPFHVGGRRCPSRLSAAQTRG